MLDISVAPKLNEIQLSKRISICDSLLKCNETDPFLKQIRTVDGKWVVYDNVVRKRSWTKRDESVQSTLKADIHQNKVMLSVWWDFKGIVYFELLPRNQTIHSNVCSRQLMKLDKEIEEKWPELANRKGAIFHQDNARPHRSLVARKKVLELGWEVMPHPLYSPDPAPHDYHLFRSLQNHFRTKLSATGEL